MACLAGCSLAMLACLLEPAGKALGQTVTASARQLLCEPESGTWNGRTIVLISGDEEYRSEEALPMLGRMLSRNCGFRCIVLFAIDPETGQINPDLQTSIPGLEVLEQADLVIMALRFRRLPDGQMRFIDDYIRSGRPVIGLRTSTHAFMYGPNDETSFRHYSFDSGDPWPGGFGRQVLGETWISHHGEHGQQSTRGRPEPAAEGHPVLRGVEGVWGPTDVYGVTTLPDDAVVLMRGEVVAGMQPDSPTVHGPVNEPMMPLVWCREIPLQRTPETDPAGPGENGNSHPSAPVLQRVLCTTMGAATDFENPGLRRLLANGAYWCLGMEDQITGETDVDPGFPYQPSPFGFGTWQRGRTPAFYAEN